MELVSMTGSFAQTGMQALRRAGSMDVGDLGARYAGKVSAEPLPGIPVIMQVFCQLVPLALSETTFLIFIF
jgi:hypothetical protein